MWQKELKQLKKQIQQPLKIEKKQTETKLKNDSVSFIEYCKSLNINKLDQDKIVNTFNNKPKNLYRPVTYSHVNQHVEDFDFIDINDTPDELFHNGQKNLPRDLRSSKYMINKTIDIHGSNKNQAWQQIEYLIEKSDPGSVIKIIHGQGVNSKHNQPILQNTTRKLLYHNNKILAYTYGSPEQGGQGVTIIKLRS